MRLGIFGLAVGMLMTSACLQGANVKNSPVAEPTSVSAAELDKNFADDAKFYAPMAARMEGALMARPPADVSAATQDATVVVAARIGDIKAQRVIGDIQTLAISLTDVDVLSGELEPSLGQQVNVELALGDPADVGKNVNSFRAVLPKGYGIWFLRWQGDKKPVTKKGASPSEDPADSSLYALVHRQSMFTQGRNGAVNPIAEHDHDGGSLPGLQADGERFSKLSEIADKVRASKK
ncbi:hypothetical protein AB0M36_13535 [Actinoplanes sp. NPDC051346]|uniref:hypothetical protein n=1 Tax=Actinoplanes sp. NPDC051346 TaxID=3155048 RepID=UPI0034239179